MWLNARRRGRARRLHGGWSVERRARDRAADRDARALLRRGGAARPRARARGRRAVRTRRAARPRWSRAAATFVVGLARARDRRRASRAGSDRARTPARSPRDRFLGASFGAVRGALLAMMVVYLAMWFDALRATGGGAVLPEIGDSVAADVTSGVVQSAIESAVDTSRARRALHGALRIAARGFGGRAPVDLRRPEIRASCAATSGSGTTSRTATSTRRSSARSFLNARARCAAAATAAHLGLVTRRGGARRRWVPAVDRAGARGDRSAPARAAQRSRRCRSCSPTRRWSRCSRTATRSGCSRTRSFRELVSRVSAAPPKPRGRERRRAEVCARRAGDPSRARTPRSRRPGRSARSAAARSGSPARRARGGDRVRVGIRRSHEESG